MDLYRKYFNGTSAERPPETEPNWGVSILNVGHNAHPANKRYPDPQHPESYQFDFQHGRILREFQLVYISDGSGIFESAHLPPTPVQAGTAFLLYPGVWHRYQPASDTGWEEFWVGFDGPYAGYLMQQDCFNPQNPLLPIGFNAELLNVFIRLVDTLKYKGIAHRQMASCLVIQLLGLVYASALMADRSQSDKERVVHLIRFQIHEQWASPLGMQQLAAANGVGYVWFRKAFKELTGIAPGQYHLGLKIDKACQMLRETSLSVAEVAVRSGFESEFYFSRVFKKKMGLSPSAYRANAK
nr:AraC family transcriptional regulator [uncultured Dyadobacter sp.]